MHVDSKRPTGFAGSGRAIPLPRSRITHPRGEEMLAALVKYFIRERRLNLGKSTRKQQRVRY
jgi:hypothetical protein